MHLVYDTETTGLPDWRAPSDAPHQPHMVQLAALLVRDDGTEAASFSVIIWPEGWEIPQEAAYVHGITTEKAEQEGIPEALAVKMLLSLWGRADQRIGHNERFDARIIRIAMKRGGAPFAAMLPAWANGRAFCTADAATPLCALPPTEEMLAAGFNKPKRASLSEAHRHLLGADFDGAHDAMADVRACWAVYQALSKQEGAPYA